LQRDYWSKGKTTFIFYRFRCRCSDAVAARKVADFLATEHHEIYFSVEEGIKILDKLIWHLETYDVTSIRASTPMYFLSKAISDLGIKVVLSGKGLMRFWRLFIL
jgi:asparagine synthetase B (glutamine-hydrolysing)